MKVLWCSVILLWVGSGSLPRSFHKTHECGSLLVPHFLLVEVHASCQTVNEIDVISMSVTYVFFQLSTVLSILSFVYCFLRMVKKRSLMPLVQQWEEYIAPNHSKFAATDEEQCLDETRVLVALAKVSVSNTSHLCKSRGSWGGLQQGASLM